MDKHYRTKVHYSLVFITKAGFRVWGNLAFFNPAIHSMGWASQKSSFDRDFYLGSNGGNWGAISNATHHYLELCDYFNIPRPPSGLVIWAFKRNKGDWAASTPMFQHSHVSNILQVNLTNTIGLPTLNILPDIFVFKFNDICHFYSTMFHELAHASHFRNVGRDYWNVEITQTCTNLGYGNYSNINTGIIGVVEMWGPYFGEYKCFEKQYQYAYPQFQPNENWFKPGIMQDLDVQAGLTARQIYNALTSKAISHNSLKKQLINLYPHKKNAIEQCFKQYGF
ncbi:MAG: hypothetical protein IJ150_01185 [Bacteroidales bacterium]|nr:hypothetical protein [Bacteroidales bacterium]